jgi:hypothetical protein
VQVFPDQASFFTLLTLDVPEKDARRLVGIRVVPREIHQLSSLEWDGSFWLTVNTFPYPQAQEQAGWGENFAILA